MSKVQSRHTPSNNFGNNANILFNGKQFANTYTTHCNNVKNQSHRILAAPFQPTTALTNKIVNLSLSTNDCASDVILRNEGDSQIDSSNESRILIFRKFKFKPLENFFSLKLSTYCGPTPESNWVIPGVLLVGAYPASQSDEETLELLTSILALRVTKFVCLQLEYRAEVTEKEWRHGNALRPYFDDVKRIVADKHRFMPALADEVVSSENLKFAHCPIVDCGVTDDDRVLALAMELVQDIINGDVLYLHCWGGHGRTGTVVCIMLHLMYELTAVESMRRCQAVHDLRQCPVGVGSPQTKTQRDQVTRIINKLIQASHSHTSSHQSITPITATTPTHSLSSKLATPTSSILPHPRNKVDTSITKLASNSKPTSPIPRNGKPQQQHSPVLPHRKPNHSHILRSTPTTSTTDLVLPSSANSTSSTSTSSQLLSTVLTKQPSQQKMFDQDSLLSPASSPLLHKKIRSNTLLDDGSLVGITLVQDVSNNNSAAVEIPSVEQPVVDEESSSNNHLNGICMHMMDDADDQQQLSQQPPNEFSCPIVIASTAEVVPASADPIEQPLVRILSENSLQAEKENDSNIRPASSTQIQLDNQTINASEEQRHQSPSKVTPTTVQSATRRIVVKRSTTISTDNNTPIPLSFSPVPPTSTKSSMHSFFKS